MVIAEFQARGAERRGDNPQSVVTTWLRSQRKTFGSPPDVSPHLARTHGPPRRVKGAGEISTELEGVGRSTVAPYQNLVSKTAEMVSDHSPLLMGETARAELLNLLLKPIDSRLGLVWGRAIELAFVVGNLRITSSKSRLQPADLARLQSAAEEKRHRKYCNPEDCVTQRRAGEPAHPIVETGSWCML